MNHTSEIRLLISDFDGTLVDTEQANFLAYRKALSEAGIRLTPEIYADCFGLRAEEFLCRLGIVAPQEIIRIKKWKAAYYPSYFSELRLNETLFTFLKACRGSGKRVAIATTSRRENLFNVLNYFDIAGEFDYFVTGEDIQKGKPDPECYLKVMSHFAIPPVQSLIFEDSSFGRQAARDSGANYIVVDRSFYGNQGEWPFRLHD